MSTSTADILVVGNLMIDVVVDMPGSLELGSDLPSEIHTTFGGTGGNVGAWAAVAGARPLVVGVVGADAWGEAFERQMQRLGALTALRKHESLPTGMLVALVHPDGERSMLPDSRANSALSWGDFDEVDWNSFKWLYLSAYVLFDPAIRAVGERLLEAAADHDVRVALDPASAAPLRSIDPALLRDWLSRCDLLLPNGPETDALASMGVWESLLGSCPMIAAKRGAEGVDLHQRGRAVEHVPAAPAELVDTVGAGDAFAGGMLAALVAGASPTDAAKAAVQVAAKAVAIRGAQPL